MATRDDLDRGSRFNYSLNKRFPNLLRAVALDESAFNELQEMRRHFERLAMVQFANMVSAYVEALGAAIGGEANSEADFDRIMRAKLGPEFGKESEG